MNKMLVIFIPFLLLWSSVIAQQPKGSLEIEFNKNILLPGDSLFVNAYYNDGSGEQLKESLATLELIIENEQGFSTRLRWPIINGEAKGALYLPDSLATGKYTMLAGLQQRSFEVIGKILEPNYKGNVQAMLLTSSGAWVEREVAVNPDGSFVIKNWLFDDNALLAFSEMKKNPSPLDIRISTQLDSVHAPLAVAGKVFFVGKPTADMEQLLTQPVETLEAAFKNERNFLPAVLVRTTQKTKAQQFDEEYVSGMFRSGNERLIDIMDEPAALGSPSILTFLQGRVAGLQITTDGFNGGSARWRGGPVSFFIDEFRVSAEQLASLPVSDIAIVKTYPPPFFGAPGGNGGGIAVYTRRGGEANFLSNNKQVFRVKGYTAASTSLDMNRLFL